ncbi:conserved exported hypothetical protein [Candidatus Terasakiella magnetica]|nr:conserved exported hypothetical protein [Candidatus Terasakiella magnetica]
MRRIVLTTALSAMMGASLLAMPASAQSDTRALYDRLDRLERDLSVMQQQAARGGGGTTIRSPAAGGSGAEVSGSIASRLDDRINELEDNARQLTGRIEEINFRNAQLQKQLDRMQTDLDLRFKELQDGTAPRAQAPSSTQSVSMPTPGATLPNGAPVLIPPKGVVPGSNAADGAGPAPGPQVLGSMPEKDLKKGQAQAATQAQATPKDPQAAYDEAYSLAQKGDFDGAEKSFQAFLKANPNHQLAGNAQYWLGDIAFSQRKDFAQSAKMFGEAYKKYPKHTKAPDMLYKLGASFAQLDMKDQACRTFSLLFSEHPGMADRIKRAATGEKQRLGCKG